MQSKIRKSQLESILASIAQAPYPVHSRVHRLNSFLPHCYVKRDDELGFGITGSKIRKYRSLIPFLVQQKIEEVVVIGSAFSNNVLGISQLLIENQIRPILFLKRGPWQKLQGNLLFTQLLVAPENIYWISPNEWKNKERGIQEYIQRQGSKKIFVLQEGASVVEALPGALSLALDIAKNEEEIGSPFDHVMIDSGTGLMASATILGLSWMHKQTIVHVLLLAEQEQFFLNQLRFFHQAFNQLVQQETSFPNNFVIHTARQAPSFGSTSAAIFDEIKQMARQEGFFVDPIYTAKLFLETRLLLTQDRLQGTILINHSGGGMTLAGFQEQIKDIVEG